MADKDLVPWYQTIPELGIKGRMNTPEEYERIGLPKNLEALSVLDVGCNTGAFLLESVRRGASVVHGVEVNYVWRWLAWGILTEYCESNDGMPAPWYAVYESVKEVPYTILKYGGYHVVLLLSVTHVTKNGQELLNQAWEVVMPGGLLILEVNDRLQEQGLVMPADFKVYGKNKDNRTVFHLRKDKNG